jgi:hypothetical protein
VELSLVEQPPLAEVARGAALRAPGASAVAALNAALVEALGSEQVSTVDAVRRAASADFAHLSPILPTALPERCADVVAFPRTVDEITTAVRLAHEHGVPVTPRGCGTGNYGQAVPLAAGLVVDLTRCDQILETGAGWMKAQAGTTFVALEAAARRTGQEIAMLPTTVGSTIGGFLAGGAGGVGSIEHGWLWDDFVDALEVVTCPPAAVPLAVSGASCRPYLHAYGVNGIIATATVRLTPARERVAVLASFPEEAWADAAAAGLATVRLDPPPRLVCVDMADLVATYPPDPAMPHGRHSLRAHVDATALQPMQDIIARHRGRLEQVRPKGGAYLASLAYNHVTLRALRARPELCHLQVAGEALLTRTDEVLAAVPGALLHLEGLRLFLDPVEPWRGRHFAGLLLSPFRDAKTLYADMTRLGELGVHVVDPHTWLVGSPLLSDIRATAAVNDPAGLLNPGKLPPP